MRWVLVAVAVVAALVVGPVFGWRWVFAPLFALAFIKWSTGSMRAMTSDARASAHLDQPQPVVVPATERTLYWCEECGTEFVLLVRGTGKPPRHCGTAMHAREEVAGQ